MDAGTLTAIAGVLTAATAAGAYLTRRRSTRAAEAAEQAKKSADVIRAEREGWTSLIRELRGEVVRSTSHRGELRAELAELRVELMHLERENERLRAHLETLQARLGLLERRDPPGPAADASAN